MIDTNHIEFIDCATREQHPSSISRETVKNAATSVDASTVAHTDEDARSERFHELVDRRFLGILTPEEAQELEILTKWVNEVKSAFYRNIVTD